MISVRGAFIDSWDSSFLLFFYSSFFFLFHPFYLVYIIICFRCFDFCCFFPPQLSPLYDLCINLFRNHNPHFPIPSIPPFFWTTPSREMFGNLALLLCYGPPRRWKGYTENLSLIEYFLCLYLYVCVSLCCPFPKKSLCLILICPSVRNQKTGSLRLSLWLVVRVIYRPSSTTKVFFEKFPFWCAICSSCVASRVWIDSCYQSISIIFYRVLAANRYVPQLHVRCTTLW